MRVFISYSHDSTEHEQRVRALADQLRADGVDAWIDQYVQDPDEGWVKWMRTQVREAEKALLVFTETYQRRFEGDEEEGKGLGATFEGVIVTQSLYESGGRNAKFRPVVFRDEDAQFIPVELRRFNRYRVDTPEYYQNLLRWLYKEPLIVVPTLGQKANLPPQPGRKLFASKSDQPPVSEPASLPGSVQGVAGPQAAAGGKVSRTSISDKQDRPVGQKPERPSTPEPPAIPVDVSQIGQYAPVNLIGRESETQILSRSWNLAVRGDADRPCATVLGWSFYSQGTREVASVSADRFLRYALAFFGDPAMAGKSEKLAVKGQRLAELIGQRRALLILDGLEPLQYPHTVPMAGQLRDPGLAALLQSLAASNRGLCVVTTRISVQDLTGFLGTTVREEALTGLSADSGAMLLQKLGVVGDNGLMKELVDDVQGHALTLTLLGSFLKRAYHGDIKKRDRVKLEKADSIVQGGHAFRTVEAYEQWLLQGGEEGKREVAILRLMGLFDRPADACSIKLLCSEIIPELNEPLVGQSEEDWSIGLSKLEESHLLTVNRDDSGELVSIDAHPLLREYFAGKMPSESREHAEKLLSKGNDEPASKGDRESGKVRAASRDSLPVARGRLRPSCMVKMQKKNFKAPHCGTKLQRRFCRIYSVWGKDMVMTTGNGLSRLAIRPAFW